MPQRGTAHAYRDIGGVSCAVGCLLLASPARLTKRVQRYRIPAADLRTLVTATVGRCMVCRACHASIIEHCHFMAVVRGIVCAWCNGRIAVLERGIHWTRPVRPGRRARPDPGFQELGCACRGAPAADPEVWSLGLENATYRYLDHAMDLWTGDVRTSFARLIADPHPAWGPTRTPSTPRQSRPGTDTAGMTHPSGTVMTHPARR